MHSPAMNFHRTPKQFALSVASVLAITLFAAIAALAQQLQKGISVEMAPSHNAQPMPAADNLNAWIVTVTADGQLWFGTNSVSREGLVAEMIRTPRKRDQNLYIKADARAPYAGVASVVKAAQTAKFDAPVLLTAQPESREPGTMVPPQGLEVWIGSGAASGRKPVLVEVLSAKPDSPVLKVNGQAISSDSLQATVEQLFQGRAEKTVLLRADGAVSFAQVAHAIDACRSTGAKVVLPAPEI